MPCDHRALLCLVALGAPAWAQDGDSPALRYSAPVTVTAAGAFVQLPLSAEVYARSRDGALADVRIVDARGVRVPFALLQARPDELGHDEHRRPVLIYPLPAQAAADNLPPHIEMQIDGGRLRLRTQAGALVATPQGGARPGWVIDLGPKRADAPAPGQLALRWSGPADFTAGYRLDASADLRQWRPVGSGQVMSLAGAGGSAPLTQSRIPLPADPPRYLRLRWTDPATAPDVTVADGIAEQPRSRTLDPPAVLKLAASPDPAGPSVADPVAARSLHLDLGAVLEVRDIDLLLPAGTQVLPFRLQRRNAASERWTDATAAVAYRLDRPEAAGGPAVSPPLPLNLRARYLRLVPDERAPAIDAARTTAVVRVQLASLVFAAQGAPPYRLQVGARPRAPLADGALPLATLVPQLEAERARFGRGELGGFTEQADVARQVARDEQLAAWRPRLLWAVLLAGVVGLGFMVWRLSRGAGAANDRPR